MAKGEKNIPSPVPKAILSNNPNPELVEEEVEKASEILSGDSTAEQSEKKKLKEETEREKQYNIIRRRMMEKHSGEQIKQSMENLEQYSEMIDGVASDIISGAVNLVQTGLFMKEEGCRRQITYEELKSQEEEKGEASKSMDSGRRKGTMKKAEERLEKVPVKKKALEKIPKKSAPVFSSSK